MAVLYRIRDWNEHFENNRTREMKRMAWIPVPNKQDGDGYTALLDHPDGPAHYGAWHAILQVASKCRPRGTLLRDGAGPHDAPSIGRIARMPVDVVASALERLSSKEIGWIEVLDPETLTPIPQEGAEIRQVPASIPHPTDYGTERNGTERNGTPDSSEPQATPERLVMEFPVVGKDSHQWQLTQPLLDELAAAYPGIDVLAECRAAKAWCYTNTTKRKTPRGMPKFLNGWMERAQNRRGGANQSPDQKPLDLSIDPSKYDQP